MPEGGQPIDNALIVQATQPMKPRTIADRVKYTIRGALEAWMSPMQPLQPIAEEAKGRQWDYPVGYNINFRPRYNEPISFQNLRDLADNCDILRLCIETRKAQLCSIGWQIKPIQESSKERDKRSLELEAFFKFPNKIHTWHQWLRQVLEDHFVIDAVSIYKRKTRGGDLYSLDIIDGSTIAVKVDADGRQPMPPDVAFQQVLKGIPAVDYSAEELIYAPLNLRPQSVYGLSHVQQVLVTVNIAIRRALFQLQYYTEGNLPDAIMGTPPEWTPDNIRAYQEFFESLYGGNTAQRRKMKFIAGKVDIHELKQPPMKDQYDEWLARIICYCFKLSPQAFVSMMNRATAEVAQATSTDEGLAETQQFIKSLIDRIIVEEFGETGYEFVWLDAKEQNAKEAAEINTLYAKNGILTINEIRHDLGRDAVEGIADELSIITGSGIVPIGEAGLLEEPEMAGDNVQSEGESAEIKSDAEKIQKLKKKIEAAPYRRAVVRRAIAKSQKAIHSVLSNTATHVAAQMRMEKLAKYGERFTLDLENLQNATQDSMADVAKDAAWLTVEELGFPDDHAIFGMIDPVGVEIARARSAALVTKIDDSTRNMLNRMITDALAGGKTEGELADEIAGSYPFSAERALLIAETEMRSVNSEAVLAGWQTAAKYGIKVKKRWDVRDENACVVCEINADDGALNLDEEFSSGDKAPLAHPNCYCVLVSELEE